MIFISELSRFSKVAARQSFTAELATTCSFRAVCSTHNHNVPPDLMPRCRVSRCIQSLSLFEPSHVPKDRLGPQWSSQHIIIFGNNCTIFFL